jgi:hypothetical protein
MQEETHRQFLLIQEEMEENPEFAAQFESVDDIVEALVPRVQAVLDDRKSLKKEKADTLRGDWFDRAIYSLSHMKYKEF